MPDEQRFQIGEYWLSRRKGSQNWYATSFDPKTRQTKRASLGTSDFEKAKQGLAEYVVKNAQLKEEAPKDVLLSTLFARYYDGHAKNVASADVTLRALNTWMEHYDDATVADLTVSNQEAFISWLQNKGLADSYIRRIISAGKAALNYSYQRQELASVPYIFNVAEEETDQRVLSLEESAALFKAVQPGDKNFMYLILSYNTLGRPSAILDLAPVQVDLQARLVNLLVPGTKQNKKRRPTLPITNTLLPWLQECDGETFVNYRGKRMANNKKSFARLCERAGLPGVSRYSIRHTMATEMRRRSVDMWEVEGWLGHRMPSTSERYAKYSPDYLSRGRVAIDQYFDELQKLVNYPIISREIKEGNTQKKNQV